MPPDSITLFANNSAMMMVMANSSKHPQANHIPQYSRTHIKRQVISYSREIVIDGIFEFATTTALQCGVSSRRGEETDRLSRPADS